MGGGKEKGGERREKGEKMRNLKKWENLNMYGVVVDIHAIALPDQSDFPFFGNLPLLVPAAYLSPPIQVIMLGEAKFTKHVFAFRADWVKVG